MSGKSTPLRNEVEAFSSPLEALNASSSDSEFEDWDEPTAEASVSWTSAEAADEVYGRPIVCALLCRDFQIKTARAKGDMALVKKLEDKAREHDFFRDALDMIDWITYGYERNLKDTFLSLVNPRSTRIKKWGRIKLEAETWKKMGNGYKGYERALQIIFSRLREYAGLNDKAIQQEARRLLGEASLVVEYRQNQEKTKRRWTNAYDRHRHVIQLWKALLDYADE